MKRSLVLIVALLFAALLKAQVAIDSLSSDALNRLLIEQVERLAEESDNEETDYEDLLETYLHFSQNPINLNSEAVVHLLELHLINVFQYESIKTYRQLYGDFAFVGELEMVEGFDEQTFSIVSPVVYAGQDRSRSRVTLRQLARYGRHQVIGRYEQVLEHAQGYAKASDSALLASPNRYYLGSPQRYQLRYHYNYYNRLRFGFTMEKDAGEPFGGKPLSDSLMPLLGDKYRQGFDFYGFHLYAHDFGMVKDVALGDYKLSFGQGLTLWSGMSFGKIVSGSSMMKQAHGLKPKASAAEYGFLRGGAITLQHKHLMATAFYSIRNLDAHIATADSLNEAEIVSSLQETGYHRTISEIANKNTICQQVFGAHAGYADGHLEIGYTIHHTLLGVELQLKPSYYNQFYFQGSQLTNHGIDFKYVRQRYAVFGEAAMSSNKAMAGLLGLTVSPTGYINFTLSYRNYDKQYQNLMANAYSESSRGQGETGFYLGLEAAPAPYWKILAYADFFRFTWFTSQVYAPSWGHDYYLRVSHSLNRNASCYLQLRSKMKMKNATDGNAFAYYPVSYTKNSVRFNIDYKIGNDFALCNKAEYAHYRSENTKNSQGYFLCQDVAYKPTCRPYSFTFRYALFDTRDYDSRLYVYENDVLYSFSIPALYGKGMRVYLLGKLKLFNALTLYARIGCTVYRDRDEIGSGAAHIEGNHKTDVKVEAVWKL